MAVSAFRSFSMSAIERRPLMAKMKPGGVCRAHWRWLEGRCREEKEPFSSIEEKLRAAYSERAWQHLFRAS
jgi:hypothetical protein